MGKNRAIPWENITDLKAEINRAYDQIEEMKALLDEASEHMEDATRHIKEQQILHVALLKDYNALQTQKKRRWWDRMW